MDIIQGNERFVLVSFVAIAFMPIMQIEKIEIASNRYG
jgi:hypothetical protein